MPRQRILITGGAGFVGCNLADRLITAGHDVVLFDNFYRQGVQHNVKWLRECHGESFRVIEADIRDFDALRRAVEGVNAIYHTAGQTAVTTSVVDPRMDFDVNAVGTLNVLEAIRACGTRPVLVFTSTNKVYGAMSDIAVEEHATRYAFVDHPFGISEEQPLDFHSPYGCSNGAADQYVRDYARIYDLPTVVFRMGSIYGPHQHGIEDQAWVAYFMIAATQGRPITVYGDGKQVRDVLFIDDLVRAFLMATAQISMTAGQVYNIGGGPANTISIWAECQPVLKELLSAPALEAQHAPWRPGDQRIYVSDIRKARRDFGWEPRVAPAEGMRRTAEWVLAQRELFAR